MHYQSLAFFMPAHNEEGNLQKVVSELDAYCKKTHTTYSIIVVDDGSTDNTSIVLSQLRMQYGIDVVTHEVNRGYGAALRTGFTKAYETGHDWIAFCDSDGQFRPEDVALLFKAAHASERDVAIGYREHRADKLHRRITGRIWHGLSTYVLGFQAVDVDCGFKLFSRKAIAAIDPTKLSGDYAVISPELLARTRHAGFSVAETSIPHYTRHHGTQSGMKLSVMLSSISGLFRIRTTIRKELVLNGDDYQNAATQGLAA